MNVKQGLAIVAALLLALPCARGADVKARDQFARGASWKPASAEAVREQALSWLAARDVDEAAKAQVATLWSSATSESGEAHLLDLVCATLAAGDPRARDLVAFSSRPRRPGPLPAMDWLADENLSPLERGNLRLAYGRWLAQQSLVDEAFEQLADLKPDDVVDPAGLLFYQAVVHHRMLNRDAGLSAIARLLENEAAVPRRYASVARLMQADLEGLKDESLDHIARRMEDIRRRLDLGRAGPKVRSVEDGVIASLDKLIDQIEKQQQAAAAAAARSSKQGGARPVAPLPDSRPVEMKGPGEVAKKPIGDTSGWGNLPPRERQEALQQVGKEFPAHYRDVIEQYFRKLATENEEKGEK